MNDYPPSAPGTSPVQGLHHVTVMASDPQRNIDFYTQTLGQRLVKVTVNFDDPGTYHLYYGDLTGQPGTIMTHFPWPGAKRGVRGNGEVVATAYSAPVASDDYWLGHLTAEGLSVRRRASASGRGADAWTTRTAPGWSWCLTRGRGAPVDAWPNSPVPAEHALRGFHSVTAWVGNTAAVRELLVGQLGFSEDGQEQTPKASAPASGAAATAAWDCSWTWWSGPASHAAPSAQAACITSPCAPATTPSRRATWAA